MATRMRRVPGLKELDRRIKKRQMILHRVETRNEADQARLGSEAGACAYPGHGQGIARLDTHRWSRFKGGSGLWWGFRRLFSLARPLRQAPPISFTPRSGFAGIKR